MCRHRAPAIIAITALLSITGCKDGDDGPDDTTTDEITDTGDIPEDTTTEDGPELASLTIQVVETHTSYREYILNDTTDPIEGATVALDGPDGTRSEQTTGADGRVTFEDLDWSLGTAAVTVHKEDHVLHSVVGIDGSETEIPVGLYLIDPTADWVTISGTASNMSDTAHSISMDTDNAYTHHQEVGPDWSMKVEPGVDFTLKAVEFDVLDAPDRTIDQDLINWVLIEHAAITSDTTVDIDFSSTVPELTVSNSITMPSLRAESPLMGTTTLYGFFSAGELHVGFVAHSEPNTAGTAFDLDFDYIETTGLSPALTTYRLNPNDYFMGISVVVVEGYPETGTHDLGFLDLPDMDQVPTTTYPLHGTEFTWELFDSGLGVCFLVWTALDVNDHDTHAWRVDAPMDATSITVPDPPSTVDESSLFEASMFRGHVVLWTPPDGAGTFRLVNGMHLRLEL
jgi:hypothetical protein